MFQTQFSQFSAASVRPEVLAEVRSRFVRNVYTWMAGGLALSGATAAFVANSPSALSLIFSSRAVFYGLILAELGLVFWLSMGIQRMSVRTASWAYLGYSALNGATLSAIFLIYTPASIAMTFGVAAGTFGAAAVYGSTTKRDLTGIGAMAFMGLIGFIIASIVSAIFQLTVFGWALNFLGVAIFVALAAYDAQKIQRIGIEAAGMGEAALSRHAILGALALYLDFINLFLILLRLFGQTRD